MTEPKLLLCSFIVGGCVVIMVQLLGEMAKEVIMEFRGRGEEE